MKPLAFFLASGLAAAIATSGWAQPPEAVKPVEKSELQNKQLTFEEKTKLARENAQKRFEEYKTRWTTITNSPLKFDQPVQELGRVTDDAPVKVMFNFTNTADHPVKITSTKAGCGCTIPKLAKDTFAPGEQGAVEATFNTQHRRGLEFKDIDVQVDTPGVGMLKVGFLVETLPRVIADPVSVFMPDVRRGSTSQQHLTLIGREPGFDVTGITMADPNAPFEIKRVASTPFTDDNGDELTRVEYDVVLKPGTSIGRYNTRMVVSTNDAKRASMDVSLGAAVVGDLRVVPENVLAIGQPGLAFAKEARIDHRLAKPFNILGLETQNIPRDMKLVMDVQSAQITGQPGEVIGYTLKIAGTFPSTGGNISGKILVHTDIPDQPIIEVPFQGVIPVAKH